MKDREGLAVDCILPHNQNLSGFVTRYTAAKSQWSVASQYLSHTVYTYKGCIDQVSVLKGWQPDLSLRVTQWNVTVAL